ncbi:hypothetical protein [Geothrix sp. PMB-07]|uniref:hypothetical protein n=1 Tax=Geothrix sp. PMB-07 TaxID=3068640 RepID=UPI002741F656|nr:hypothetical protein [Geothrix sp. PMB-07]WLT33449.1 hypothetical protein Q9293_08935 [Geothrix sp. PMB-07]
MILNRRHHPRIMLSMALKATFQLESGASVEAHIDSIGLGGLGGWLDDRHQPDFGPETRIRNLHLDHAAFPSPVPDLRVVFNTQKGQGSRPGLMMFGAQFLEPSPRFQSALKDFLELANLD